MFFAFRADFINLFSPVFGIALWAMSSLWPPFGLSSAGLNNGKHLTQNRFVIFYSFILLFAAAACPAVLLCVLFFFTSALRAGYYKPRLKYGRLILVIGVGSVAAVQSLELCLILTETKTRRGNSDGSHGIVHPSPPNDSDTDFWKSH